MIRNGTVSGDTGVTRVLVVSRLFTGLLDSLASRVWAPSGVPAIYKLIESLAHRPDIDVRLVFTCKDADAAARFPSNQTRHIDGLGEVQILGWRRRPWLRCLGLDGKCRELMHLLSCLRLYFSFRPQASYFGNANIFAAGLFARFGLGRVVFRLLGLHPFEKAVAARRRGLMHWLYRSPFDHVVCTMDGSGGNHYLGDLICPETPVSLKLNGVDRPEPRVEDIDRFRTRFGLGGKPVVIYVGRLERTKGCREFVEGMILLNRRTAVDAVVVGYGEMEAELRALVDTEESSDAIHFTGALPHDEVPAALAAADVYVSLNQFGNLSNTNLEAIVQGKCMLLLESDPETHVDMETAELLPEESFPRVSRQNTAERLAEILNDLLADRSRMERLGAEVAGIGQRILSGWPERTAFEIDLILGTSKAQ